MPIVAVGVFMFVLIVLGNIWIHFGRYIIIGVLIIITLFILGAIKAAIDKSTEKSSQEREKIATEQRNSQEAAKRTLNIVTLDAEYDRLLSESKCGDHEYLVYTVLPALLGRDVGTDEFERRDYSRNKNSRLAVIRRVPIIYETSICGHILEYDFDKKRFPIKIDANSLSQRDKLSILLGDVLLGEEWLGFLTVSNVDQARRFRIFRPSINKIQLIFRAVSATSHGHNDRLQCQLLGLRLIEARTGRPLCKMITHA